jgi:hypothetical protein
VRHASTPSARRVTAVVLAVATVVTLLALAAGPALAADGVPLFPAANPWAGYSSGRTDISGPIGAWESWQYTPGPASSYTAARIALYDLAVQNGTPILLYDPIAVGLGDQNHPSVLVDGTTVYVVWEQWNEFDTPDDRFLDTDIWIWRGTFEETSGVLTADADFPKELATGPGTAFTMDPTEQSQPSIGLVEDGAGQHIVVAWADCRNTAPNVPEVYYVDLTADTSYADPGWDPVVAGTALDPTGIMGRGQRDPDVGAKGVFWRDERFSYYNPDDPYDPTDTAIWRANLASGTPVCGAFRTESGHTIDNTAPMADSTGAAWFRHLMSDPYDYRLWGRTATPGSSASQLTDAVQVGMGDVFYTAPGGRNYYVFGAAHGNVAGRDQDIFMYNSFTHSRVAICNYGDTTWHAWNYQTWPAVGGTQIGQRVIWGDARNNYPDDSDEVAQMNSRLYQNFVPRIILRVDRTILLRGSRVVMKAEVAPDFDGQPVIFQLVSGTSAFDRSWPGKLGNLATKTLSGNSQAGFAWYPKAPGTYWVRAWFAPKGGSVALYGPDGVTLAKYAADAIPYIASGSNLIRITVK